MKTTEPVIKTIRLQIVESLYRNGEQTVDGLMDSLPDMTRKQIQDNCIHVVNSGFASKNKDANTLLPSYSITDAGISVLEQNSTRTNPFIPAVIQHDATVTHHRCGKTTKSAPPKVKVIAPKTVGPWAATETIPEGVAELNKRMQAENDLMMQNLRTAQIDRDKLMQEVEALTKQIEDYQSEKQANAALYAKCIAIRKWLENPKYMLRVPKRKPAIFNTLQKAQETAMRAAKSAGAAEVFVLLPSGKAIRGAQWVEASI